MKKELIRKSFHRIAKWYAGEDVRIDENEPDTIGGLKVLHETENKFHWSASLTRSAVNFIARNGTNKLMLLFSALAAIGTIGNWVYPIKQPDPIPVPPITNQNATGQKTPPPSTKPHKKTLEHITPSKSI